MSEIRIVKLTTQEDIICKHEFHEETGTHTLKSPCIMIQTAEGFGAMPYMPYAKHENGIPMDDRHVMTVVEPEATVRAQYDEQFGSGLIVPKKQQVVSTGPIGVAS
jgi:hypothetical protein